MALGADMMYIESSAELTWLKSNNIFSTTYPVLLNAQQVLYGTPNGLTVYWSNGQEVLNGQFGLNYANGEPNTCSFGNAGYTEALIWVPGSGLATVGYNAYSVTTGTIWGTSGCKRQLCGT